MVGGLGVPVTWSFSPVRWRFYTGRRNSVRPDVGEPQEILLSLLLTLPFPTHFAPYFLFPFLFPSPFLLLIPAPLFLSHLPFPTLILTFFYINPPPTLQSQLESRPCYCEASTVRAHLGPSTCLTLGCGEIADGPEVALSQPLPGQQGADLGLREPES